MAEAGTAAAGTAADLPSEPIRWWTDLFAEHAERIALGAASLLSNEAAWVHRRVFKIEMIDNNRVRWTQSIDMSIPQLPELPEELPLVVPLTVLPRLELLDLDVRDGDGTPIAVLTRSQNTRVAAELALHRAREVMRNANEELEEDVAEHIRDVAGYAPGGRWVDVVRAHEISLIAYRKFIEAIQLASRAKVEVETHAAGAADADVSRFGGADAERGDPNGGVGVPNEAGFVWPSAVERQMAFLWRDASMRQILEQLQDNYILFVEIERPSLSSAEALAHETFALAETEDGNDANGLTFTTEPVRKFAVVQYVRASVFTGSKWFEPWGARIDMVLPSFRGAPSHHLHFAAPSGLLVHRLALKQWILRLTDDGSGTPKFDYVDGYETEVGDAGEIEPHLYVNNSELSDLSREDDDIAEAMTASAWLSPRLGLVMPATLGSLLTSLTLLCGIVLRSRGFHAAHDATVVLVAVPVLFTPFLAEAEDLVLRRILLRLRYALYANAITGFGAAAVLVLSVPTWVKFAGWGLALVVSLLCTLSLTATAVNAWRLAHVPNLPQNGHAQT